MKGGTDMMTLILVLIGIAFFTVLLPVLVVLLKFALPAILVLVFILLIPLTIGGMIGYALKMKKEERGDE